MGEPSTPKTLPFGGITSVSPLLEGQENLDVVPPLDLDAPSDSEEPGNSVVERAQQEWENEAKDHATFLLALNCDEAIHLAKRFGLANEREEREEDKASQCRCFVPRHVIEYFKDHDKLTEQHEHTVTAAVMFADISGFTRLTEQLTQNANARPELKSSRSAQSLSPLTPRQPFGDGEGEGSHQDLEEDHIQSAERGAEELVNHLNAYFDQIIDVMHVWGGDIIKFAGDAMLCLFLASDDDLAQAANRAVQCARDLHSIDPAKRRVNSVQLSLHIGVGAGDVRFAFVGGKHERWEYLICDQEDKGPVYQVGMAEGGALPEETVVSEQAFELLVGVKGKAVTKQGKLHGLKVTKYPRAREDGSNVGSIQSNAELELRETIHSKMDVIETFLPGAVRNRWDQGNSKWMCDLRRVTVLFINLKGLKVTDPQFLNKLQNAMHLIQTCLYREEGSVNKFLCDDKGMTLIAAFGLPPLSHRDDPLRAVRAATQITQRMLEGQAQGESQFGVRDIVMPSIGITTGRCFCGIVGKRRREYTVMGDTVNLAARLMQHAKNEVIVDRETYQASVHEINYDIHPPITVKGKEEPVDIFTPNTEHNRLAYSLVLGSNRTRYVPHTPFIQDFLGLLSTYISNAKRWQERVGLQCTELPRDVGCVCQVTGEVGIGKSRLVEQFINRAYATAPGSVEVVMGKGVQTDFKQYGAWTPIVVCLVLLWYDLEFVRKRSNVLRWSNLMRSESEKLAEEKRGEISQESYEVVHKNYARFARVRGQTNPLLSNGLRVHAEASLRRMLSGTPHSEHLDACFSLLEIGTRGEAAAKCGKCGREMRVGGSWWHGLAEADVCGECLEKDQDLEKEEFVEVRCEGDLGEDLANYLPQPVDPRARARSASKEQLLSNDDRSKLHALIKHLLVRVAHRVPLVLVFEDAHYLDSASWELLASLCKDDALCCLVCIVFNHERVSLEHLGVVTAHQREIASLPVRRFRGFALQGMSRTHIKRLAMARWGVDVIPSSQVLDMLIAGSEGNPLFCEGLMDELMERNIVRVVGEKPNSQLVLVNPERLSMVRIEQDLVAMLRARLDHLHANLQRTVKTAACVASFNGLASHPCFTTHLLLIADSSWAQHKGLNSKRDKLEASLQALVDDHGIFEKVDMGGEGGLAYRFRSRLFRDVVYRSIPFTERKSIHLGLAMMLQWQRSSNAHLKSLSPRHQVMLLEMIATHFSNSSQSEPAFSYGLEFGMRLLDLSNDRKAAAVLLRTLVCFEELRAAREAKGENDDAGEEGWQYLGAVCSYLLGVAKMRLGQVPETRSAMETALRILDIRLPSTKIGIASAIASERVKKKMRKRLSSMPSDTPVMQSGSRSSGVWQTKKPAIIQTFQSNRDDPHGDALVDGRELEEGVSDAKFNKLLATIYTSLGVVYYESNEKQLGDLSSAMAIAKAQQARSDESGLVSQSYAHACLTSLLGGQMQRAVAYKEKAELHLKQLRNFPAHNRIKADVLLSIATHDAGLGQWNSAIAHLSHAVMLAKQVDDDRLWERCAIQLASIHSIRGNTLHALTMLVSVYQNWTQGQAVDGSASSIELSTLNAMGWCLVTLGSVVLAKELMKSAQSAARLTNSTDADDSMPLPLCLWLCQQPSRALVNAYNAILSMSGTSRAMWHRYRLLVSVLDTLFLQWARMLARFHDLGEAKPDPAPDNPPGILGLGSANGKRRSAATMGEMAMESDFVDDVPSIHSQDAVIERAPFVRKPLKKVLKILADFAKVYPFASSIPDVYWCWYKLFNNEPIGPTLAEMWSKLRASSSAPLPQREEVLAIVLTLIATPNNPECPALKRRLDEMVGNGELTTMLHLRVLWEFQHDPVLQNFRCTSAFTFAKLVWTLYDRVAQRVCDKAERMDSQGLAGQLEPSQLPSAEEFEQMRRQSAELVAKKVAGIEEARLLSPDMIHCLRLVVQEQYFKKARQRHWVAENNVESQMFADI